MIYIYNFLKIYYFLLVYMISIIYKNKYLKSLQHVQHPLLSESFFHLSSKDDIVIEIIVSSTSSDDFVEAITLRQDAPRL